MILKESINIPVAAAQINDMNASLILFRNFKGMQEYQMSHFITFLNTPGYQRDEFYKLFAEELVIMNNRYAKRTLTIM